jgi:O-antigen ligase
MRADALLFRGLSRTVNFLMRIDFLFGATAVLLVTSLALGGGTKSGLPSDGVLQLAALPLLWVSLARWLEAPADRRPRWVLPFLGAIAGLFVIQLIPLPPSLWTRLPGRELVADAFELLNRPLPWRALSVAPFSTSSGLLSLIPASALFLAIAALDRDERRRLVDMLLGFSLVSVLLGLTQIAQGPNSPLRLFTETNATDAVGFFANRNHFAALLYCAILFASARLLDAERSACSHPRLEIRFASFILHLAGATTIVVLLAGEAMARSRAGIVLAAVAVFGSFALSYSRGQNRRGGSSRRSLFAATAVALAISLQFTFTRMLGRFDDGIAEDGRWIIARRTIAAAIDHSPLGVGLGAFVPVYASYERPQDTLINAYVNHAHNDFLEIWLESGLVAPLLVCVFVAWWSARSFALWRDTRAKVHEIDPYARAATIIVALLLTHSFVDYPLRTSAMMAVLALACASMIEPFVARPHVGTAPLSSGRRDKHRNRRSRDSATITPITVPPSTPRAITRPSIAPPRGAGPENVEWPKQWRTGEEQLDAPPPACLVDDAPTPEPIQASEAVRPSVTTEERRDERSDEKSERHAADPGEGIVQSGVSLGREVLENLQHCAAERENDPDKESLM